MDDENGNGAQNLACQACEWADSSIDARHVFTSNFAYEMPFARGNRYLGGWHLSGVVTCAHRVADQCQCHPPGHRHA